MNCRTWMNTVDGIRPLGGFFTLSGRFGGSRSRRLRLRIALFTPAFRSCFRAVYANTHGSREVFYFPTLSSTGVLNFLTFGSAYPSGSGSGSSCSCSSPSPSGSSSASACRCPTLICFHFCRVGSIQRRSLGRFRLASGWLLRLWGLVLLVF